MTVKVDVRISREGTIFMFAPLTRRAKRWTHEHVSIDAWQWLGGAFSVDQHYAEDLAAGMSADGLVVR